MRFAIMTALALIALAAPANAKTIRCQAGSWWDSSAKADVTITINEGDNSSAINVFGSTHAAICYVKGLERRCVFGEDFDFALIIESGGDGRYYDFSNARSHEVVDPSQPFICR